MAAGVSTSAPPHRIRNGRRDTGPRLPTTAGNTPARQCRSHSSFPPTETFSCLVSCMMMTKASRGMP